MRSDIFWEPNRAFTLGGGVGRCHEALRSLGFTTTPMGTCVSAWVLTSDGLGQRTGLPRCLTERTPSTSGVVPICPRRHYRTRVLEDSYRNCLIALVIGNPKPRPEQLVLAGASRRSIGRNTECREARARIVLRPQRDTARPALHINAAAPTKAIRGCRNLNRVLRWCRWT